MAYNLRDATHHRAMKSILVALLLVGCASQPKTRPQAFESVPQRSVAIRESVVIAPKPLFLTWDSPADITEWKVYTGPSRDNWTNNLVVATNRIPFAPGRIYGVTALGYGAESAPAYWPSNRVADLVLVAEDITTGAKLETLWMRYTNAPEGKGKLLRLREDFVRWE